MQNPLENGLDDAPEDALMDNANVDIYPEPILEAWERCHFNLDFPKMDHLKAIVREHARTLFQPFDQEGLRVQPLKLKINPSATFRIKDLADLYVKGLYGHSTSYWTNSCPRVFSNAFARPLVIVQKNEGGIRLAVDY